MFRRKPKPIRNPRTWVLAWLAVIIGAFGAAFFHHVSTVSRKATEAVPIAPFVRLDLGADLWTFTDSNLLDRTPRRFPDYSVEALESRSILDVDHLPLPGEMLILAPAERFLAEEFIRQSPFLPGVKVTPGPILCNTGLALVLSKDTEAQILGSSASPPRTLLDWVEDCAAASRPNHPISFCMADPDKCSSSWLGLVELIAETLGNLDEHRLQHVSDAQLVLAINQLRGEIRVSGNSDRLEMYKFLLGRYPIGTVLLVYDHLAMPLLSENSRNLTIARPEKHFNQVVQTIIISKIPDLQPSPYLPSLLRSWAAIGLAQPDAFITSNSSPGTNVSRVPDYMTMKRVLDEWNSGQPPNHDK